MTPKCMIRYATELAILMIEKYNAISLVSEVMWFIHIPMGNLSSMVLYICKPIPSLIKSPLWCIIGCLSGDRHRTWFKCPQKKSHTSLISDLCSYLWKLLKGSSEIKMAIIKHSKNTQDITKISRCVLCLSYTNFICEVLLKLKIWSGGGMTILSKNILSGYINFPF